MAHENFYYTNGEIAVVARSGGPPVSLSAAFDEDPSLVDWGPRGIWIAARQRTESGLFRLRVPLPNAYELYQGLVDQGVEAKLIVFKGFGHGLNKPKAVRAALEQNLEWFTERVLDAR